MKKSILILAIFISGCATIQKMSQVSLGMGKGDVISVMGNPNNVRAKGNTEYLIYNLREGGGGLGTRLINPGTPYFVMLVDGKVESYGKVGDFGNDLSKDATVNVNVK